MAGLKGGLSNERGAIGLGFFGGSLCKSKQLKWDTVDSPHSDRLQGLWQSHFLVNNL
jgi:hypothetical protein